MRVAAIDIGTNTILMLIAEAAGPNASPRALADEATIVRLGEGVDRARALKPEAIERARACLERYAEIAKALGVDRAAAVGTSALRDASGGAEIAKLVRDLMGSELRVISGDEEARLTFHGGLSGLELEGESAVFDIGGGSTEVVLGGKEIRYAQSFDVGSVRLTERHVRSDPPIAPELAAVTAEAVRVFEPLRALELSGELVGIAGTVTTLAAIDLALVPYDGSRVHGHVLDRARIDEIVHELASKTLEERRAVPGLEPKRADVIVQGCLLVRVLMDHLQKGQLRVSDRGVRWGLALELLTQLSQNI